MIVHAPDPAKPGCAPGLSYRAPPAVLPSLRPFLRSRAFARPMLNGAKRKRVGGPPRLHVRPRPETRAAGATTPKRSRSSDTFAD